MSIPADDSVDRFIQNHYDVVNCTPSTYSLLFIIAVKIFPGRTVCHVYVRDLRLNHVVRTLYRYRDVGAGK